jgi:HNH endonuclease
MKSRRDTYKKRWRELIEYYGARCYYCRKEIATTIDHVVPYSWDAVNDIDNLVPACVLCNCLAGDKVFDDVEEKRRYILQQRSKRANMRAICTECLLPFGYRSHSPSMFLCAECYDVEHDTHLARKPEWNRWLRQLRLAGIPVEAHRKMKDRMKSVRFKTRDEKMETLIDEYSYIVDTDDEFAEMLMIA